MKKQIPLLLIMILCLCLSGCSHDHAAEEFWAVSAGSHWHFCQWCSTHLDEASHSFDENGSCTVCSISIVQENGITTAQSTDDQGNTTLSVTFSPDGDIETDDRYFYEYDDQGRILSNTHYADRKLADKTTYRLREDGSDTLYMAEHTVYNSDVSTTIWAYDEQDLLQTITTLDANGKVHTVERFEYEFDDQGNRTKVTVYTNDLLTRIMDDVNHVLHNYNEYGDEQLTRTYVYADSGELIKEVVHYYGRLDHESYYKLHEGDHYVYKTIVYNENGEVDKETYYDVNGREIK
jgi:hypothetical protein